ncbi:LysR substrate-binding domain-containing protein [Streptomyces sp. H10-C2]|uniref:LysR family transcriptional regulator n=1 Tax=unclassified Streptomyces TaxID=2593676 RepID=UPI0024B8DEF6|nr:MULTISPECIES: LysR family transcriptional regulator [unclassified Streptomyces]MDJ0345054.1 LysR substrate-binding domain-containing protein [Streptomyces sp. PH10-H1]MDJ0370831.1 LysR substrate-binding domain-containing protein [Streptomyces sp. H10-C2]
MASMPESHVSDAFAGHGDFSTSWLRVFAEVARLGSFTAAAQWLGYTQSAVSRQISALEGQAGAPLFDRLPRGVRLTEAGRCLLPHAEAVLDRLGTARQDLTALRDLDAGRLRIGAFPTAEAALVPRAIAAFRARHPAITVTLREGLTPIHLAGLAAGEIDIAVVSTTAGHPLEDFDLHHLLDESMFVALPAGHALAGRSQLRLAELAAEQWVTGSPRPGDTLISSSLRTGFQPRIGFIAAEWIAKQGFVAAGLGVTLIPELAAASVRPDITLVALHPDDVKGRAVYAATARGLSPSPAVGAFLGLLGEAVAGLLGGLGVPGVGGTTGAGGATGD